MSCPYVFSKVPHRLRLVPAGAGAPPVAASSSDASPAAADDTSRPPAGRAHSPEALQLAAAAWRMGVLR